MYRVQISKPEKVFFPEQGITKGELVEYYRRIAPKMLPYTKGRALTLERFPDGITGGRFYQKDASDYFPDWIRRARLAKKGGEVDYVVGDDADTLAYLANQGTITFHGWLSRADHPNHPDQLIVDLDPSGADFKNVIKGAKTYRRIFDELGMESFVKTTGSRGLHVMVPLDRKATFDDARRFAGMVSESLAARDPDLFTMEHRKEKRDGRVFLDVGRNAYAQHAVVPYSVRPISGAPVATPLSWDELRSGLDPQKFNIRNIFKRLERREDPWKRSLRLRYSLSKAMSRL